MGSVRVAIVGVGNCATSLIQGVHYYRDADPVGRRPRADARAVRRLPRQRRRVRRRVRRRRQEGRLRPLRGDAGQREQHHQDLPTCRRWASRVQRGPTLDGLGKYYLETIEESDSEPVDVVQVLKDTKADVLVSYLPVGSEEADKFYAQCAIDAKVAFVNALPVFIASDPEWAKKFEDAGVPIVGDDIKSQVGATITHRVMMKLFEDRGVVVDRTYQLNVGGNMDFKNMLERDRLESKKISKTQSVTSNIDHDLGARNVHIGPSDYIAVARRPQVGLRPDGGSRLRQRPDQPGVQARGLGLAQLGRHHHRRRSARRRSPRTAASAARSCRPRPT